MSRALCFRCDWEGEAADACPCCGAPLYLDSAAPAVQEPPTGGERPAPPEGDAEPAEPAEPAGGDHPEAPADREPATTSRAEAVRRRSPREPATPTIEGEEAPRRTRAVRSRPARWLGAAAAVALVAGILWAQRTPDPGVPRSVSAALEGTLVYAAAGGDGTTGRLWVVNVASGAATEGPRTILPDEIVASGPGEAWIGVRAGGSAFVYRSLSRDAAPQLLAEGQLAAWAPGGNAVFLVTREASARGRCPLLRMSFVDSLSHGSADLYEKVTCSTVDGLAVDGLTRPFVSLAGPTAQGVYELGYRKLHKVVPRYALLGVSPVGDMLVGPRVEAPTGPAAAPSPVLRTLLVWQGVGGPIIIGDAENDLRAERFLAWSEDGHRAAILGTLGDERAVWVVDIEPGEGREHPLAVSPELTPSLGAVGATFAGDSVLVAAGGTVYASAGRGYREIELPDDAPPPTGPMLWLDTASDPPTDA